MGSSHFPRGHLYGDRCGERALFKEQPESASDSVILGLSAAAHPCLVLPAAEELGRKTGKTSARFRSKGPLPCLVTRYDSLECSSISSPFGLLLVPGFINCFFTLERFYLLAANFLLPHIPKPWQEEEGYPDCGFVLIFSVSQVRCLGRVESRRSGGGGRIRGGSE